MKPRREVSLSNQSKQKVKKQGPQGITMHRQCGSLSNSARPFTFLTKVSSFIPICDQFTTGDCGFLVSDCPDQVGIGCMPGLAEKVRHLVRHVNLCSIICYSTTDCLRSQLSSQVDANANRTMEQLLFHEKCDMAQRPS